MITQHAVIDAFLSKLHGYGVRLSDPGDIKLDGEWHRAHVEGDSRSARNLSYRIHFDDRPAGFFEDHKRGFSDTFSVVNGVDMDPAARAEAQKRWAETQRQREAQREQDYQNAAAECMRRWSGAGPVSADHPYLARKQLAASQLLRQTGDLLVIPLYSDFGGANNICSLQTIDGDGGKLFHPGGRTAGAFHPIAGPDQRRILICEGWATGKSVADTTGHSVLCAMSAANLAAVYVKAKAKFPSREIVIMADNDHGTESRTGVNPGLKYASAIEGPRILRPLFPEDSDGTDWDDWLRINDGELLVDRLESGADDRPKIKTPAAEGGDCEGAPGCGVAPRDREEREGTTGGVDDTKLPTTAATRAGKPATIDDAEDDSGLLPERYTEDNAALYFSAMHHDQLRYVASWGKWMQWGGDRWSEDTSLNVMDLSRRVCRDVSTQARADGLLKAKQQASVAHKYGSIATITAVERMARADRRHAATADQWDADIWALNTPAGVVDLRTGAIRDPRPSDYMTKITRVSPAHGPASEVCPTWLEFLHTATQGDAELQLFLQRMAGYAITGSTRDHALFFVYGSGGNGKGTFLNTLTDLVGDYAQVASMDLFTENKGDQHPTGLAALRGARMVTAQETEEGKRWAEARIKSLTGGDPIRARFMRQDEFEFIPQCKLIIAGNHKPGLRNVDEAIKRRLRLIPFTADIPADKRDAKLPEKLKLEHAGILQWAIQGARDWYSNGLAAPRSVLVATDEYLSQQDTIGSWIDECCELSGQATSSALYASYKAWAERAGEHPMTQKRWVGAMETRGFRSRKSHGSMVYDGIHPPPNRGSSSPDPFWDR